MCSTPLTSVSTGLCSSKWYLPCWEDVGWVGNRQLGGSELLNWLNLSSPSDTHKWSTPRVLGTVPGARDGHSACVLGKTMYIFGGYEQLVGLESK